MKGRFASGLDLAPGRHEYKYVVDGEWQCCPDAPRSREGRGGENSVIEVSWDFASPAIDNGTSLLLPGSGSGQGRRR